MGLDLDNINGQTPIDEDEKDGLLIPTISTRADLDEYEQENIEEAIQWLHTRALKSGILFTEKFIKGLHRRMYGSVWRWAGTFRTSNKNLGVHPTQITVALKTLLDDAAYWTEKSTYPPDEIAIRFKHRLVSIHCFPNGNGRHSRLMADIIVGKIFKEPVFTWGEKNLINPGESRTVYLAAVKAADSGNYKPLLSFARS